MLPQRGCGGNHEGAITTNGDRPTRHAELARECWAREFLTTESHLLFDPHSFVLPFLCPFPSPHSDFGKRSREGPTEDEQSGDPCQAPRLLRFGGGNYATELAQVAGRKIPVIEESLANRSGRGAGRRKSNRPTNRPFHRPSVRGRTTGVTRRRPSDSLLIFRPIRRSGACDCYMACVPSVSAT